MKELCAVRKYEVRKGKLVKRVVGYLMFEHTSWPFNDKFWNDKTYRLLEICTIP